MALVLFHTDKVKQALKSPAAVGLELLVLGGVAAVFFAAVTMARQTAAPMRVAAPISLSFLALPQYTLMSLCRGFAAYALSLIFTLIYGTIAAHNHKAEKVMLPLLDVLQSIPVLGFLPGLVLALVALFPHSELGLELACVVMIFTAQAWNMTFSFHGSLRSIPQQLREAAALQRFSRWQTFRILEVPSSMIGLVWNSMMSMAGGWFFLTVNEAFTLKGNDYRLPGIGSYMNEAINQGNTPAMLAAIVAMVIMIVLVDQVFWRPIVVWSYRYRLEDTDAGDTPHSWALSLFQKSRLLNAVARLFRRKKADAHGAPAAVVKLRGWRPAWSASSPLTKAALTWARRLALLLLAVGVGWCMWKLVALLLLLPVHSQDKRDWVHVLLALLASFARTSSAVVLGAAWALPVGILIGRSAKWSQRLQPFVQVAASFPAPMLFPLVTIVLVKWLGMNFNYGCVALMLLGAQWYILFNVIAGASAIPHDLREVGRLYRMGAWQRWTRLYIPCVFPFLVTGLVTAAGGAWNATIVSEYLQMKGEMHVAFGLGSLISQATEAGNFPLLAASVVSMAAFVVLLNRFWWKRLYRLAENRYSLNV